MRLPLQNLYNVNADSDVAPQGDWRKRRGPMYGGLARFHSNATPYTCGLDLISWTRSAFAKKRWTPKYAPDFRQNIVQLTKSATFATFTREFEIWPRPFPPWDHHKAIESSERDGLTSDERAEFTRLRRENKTLRIDRDILRKSSTGSLASRRDSPKVFRFMRRTRRPYRLFWCTAFWNFRPVGFGLGASAIRAIGRKPMRP